ncbi:MAG: ATP-binding cassette domain-containing protein [Pseudomonadota bacterium]
MPREMPHPVATDVPGAVPEIKLDNLSVDVTAGRQQRRILACANLSVSKGDVVAIIGPSGGGKSTLLKAILGLVPFTEGALTFRGTSATRPLDRVHRTLRHQAEAVFQNPVTALNPHRPLRHTVEEPLAARGMKAAARRQLAEKTAAQMGLPSAVLDRRPHAVSVGQAQRAAIARALAPRPQLLFLDEPLSALDAIIAHDVANLLAEITHEVRPTVMMVSHDLKIVRRFANRVVVVDAGRIVEDASAADFLAAPASQAGQALVQSDQRRRAVFAAAAAAAGRSLEPAAELTP